MSRIGKLPVKILAGVKVSVSGLSVVMEGPKGKIQKEFFGGISIDVVEGSLVVSMKEETSKAMWGTARSIINNMMQGVAVGFKEELEVNGVGYRASVKNGYLNLLLGKSHNTKIHIPAEIDVETPRPNAIILECNDKQKLGQYAALIRSQRKPEPYKGKGIIRKGEYVARKSGKKKG